MAEIFRKAALERLSSPEQLDKQIRTTSPMAWLAVSGVAVVVAAVTVWGFLGSLPEKTEVNGLLVEDGYFHGVYTEASGVLEIRTEVGDDVKKGDVIALINNEDVSTKIEETEEIIDSIEKITLTSVDDPSIAEVSKLLELKLSYQQNTQSEQYDTQLKELEDQLAKSKKKTDKLYKEYKDAEKAYLNSVSNDGYNVVTYDYQNAVSASETAGNQYSAAVTACNQAASQYNTVAQGLAQAAEALGSAKANYEATAAALEQAQAEYEAYKGEKTQELSEMEAKIADTSARASELEAAYNSAVSEHGESSTEAISAKVAYDEANLSLQTLQSTYTLTQNQVNATLQQQEAQIQKYSAAVNEYGTQYQAAQATYDQTEKAEQDAKAAFESANEAMESAKAEYESAKAKADAKKAEYEKAYKQQNSTAAGTQELSQKLNEKSSLYSNAYSEQMSLENSISNLRVQMSMQQIADTSSDDSIGKQFTVTKAAMKKQYETELDKLKSSMNSLEICADVDGTVTMIGVENAQVVSAGSCIARIKTTDDDPESHVVCFVPLSQAKQLKEGMEVTMKPAGVNEHEYGHMIGTVESVSENNASIFEMTRTLGDDLLVSQLQQQGASIKVILTPEKDATSENGYAWTNKKGKTVTLSDNSIVMADVITDRYAPVTKLIPFLKDKLYSNGEGD